ncbi:MAG: hypothetical protein K6B69_14980 [Lachnospiraceae bacterium]|nr:hypothetical protein [Lachnospiraceae bacterium]
MAEIKKEEKRKMPVSKETVNVLCWGVVLLTVCVLLEVFLFNIRFWDNLGNTPLEVPLESISYETQIFHEEAGDMILQDEKGQNLLYLDLAQAGMAVKNIALDLDSIERYETWTNHAGEAYAIVESGAVNVSVVLNEDGKYLSLKKQMLAAGQTDVICFPKTSCAEGMTLLVSSVKGNMVRVRHIWLNAQIPFRFRIGRCLAVFAAGVFVLLFQPGSMLWKRKVLTDEGKMDPALSGCMFSVLAFFSILIFFAVHQNFVFVQNECGFAFYRKLAHALVQGNTYVELQPSPELLAMEDPYDPIARMEGEVPYYLDYAFYQGKYYVYFGIIPCLLFYLPLYVLLGIDIKGWVMLSILLTAIIAGLALVLKEMCIRYRKDWSWAEYLLTWLASVAVLSLPAAMGDSNNYYIPQTSAIMFFLFGLAGYLAAARRIDAGKGEKRLLAIASLFMAFTAGCRPQVVFAAAVVLPLILPYLFVRTEKGVRAEWKRILCFSIPYLVTAVGLMFYNQIRFGNPLDFGSAYNLTYAKVQGVSVRLQTAVTGWYYYLLRPWRLYAEYPYLFRADFVWDNPDMLAMHPSTGGIFLLYPVLLTGFAVFRKAKGAERPQRELLWFGRIAMGMVFVLVMLDAVMGGMMDRYKMDFTPIAALAMIAAFMSFHHPGIEAKKVTILKRLIYAAGVAAALLISLLTYGVEGLNSLYTVNPEAYAAIARTIEFWR